MYIPPDTGCEYSPSCLECQRPTCIEDDSDFAVQKRWRDAEILRLARLGCREEARQRYGISARTVARIVQEGAC